MDFGVVLQTNPPASGVIAMMQRAEEAGFSYGWTWDSHVLWQEPFVIYDPQARQTLSAATHHMNVDYSAYEGMEITGQVVTTLSRGRVVIGDGAYQGSPGHGAFLSRGPNQYLV